MKSIGVALLFLAAFSFAKTDSLFILAGMRNNHYAFAGVKFINGFGISYENSVLVERPSLQYGNVAAFYAREFSFHLKLHYALYYGMRYDGDFFDVGSQVFALFDIHPRFLQLNMILQPFYDSGYGKHLGYLASIRTYPLQEIGTFVSFKNLPEYRNVERRFVLGLIFKSGHLTVLPEISRPVSEALKLTRVSVSFIYESPLF